jgi:hypothetical protein
MECVIPEEVDRIMGGRTINLSVSAQTAYDAGQLLGAALRTGKPKHIIMNLDYNAFSGAPDRSGFTEPFPYYMYDDSIWNDLPYLLGVGTLRKSLETVLGLKWSRFNTDPERMWYWMEGHQFFAAKAVQGLDPDNLNARFRQPPRTLEGMKASFEANLVPLIEGIPGRASRSCTRPTRSWSGSTSSSAASSSSRSPSASGCSSARSAIPTWRSSTSTPSLRS